MIQIATPSHAAEGIYPPGSPEISLMGEVRVTLRLASAMDDAMARRGMIQEDEVHRIDVSAMVDTGAIRTCIPEDVFLALGLELIGEMTTQYADGRSEVVGVTEPVRIDTHGRFVAEEMLVLGNEVLLGQTALEKLDLWVDCKRKRLVPNPEHPDRPISKVK